MAASVRSLARIASGSGRLNAPVSAVAATLIPGFRQTIYDCRAPCRRHLHTDVSLDTASASPQPTQQTNPVGVSTSDVPHKDISSDDSNWRHPRFGFSAADLPHLIYIKLHPTATEDDVRALCAAAGLQNTQIFMYYSFHTGKAGDYCFLKVAQQDKVQVTIDALSGFTLLGSELQPKAYNPWQSAHEPSLWAGWRPSPSSDLGDRVFRLPQTEPPQLLPTMMKDEWVAFSTLPVEHGVTGAFNKVAKAFYEHFYQFDVVGITSLRRHPTRGWCCKIQFGNAEHAKAARRQHADGMFLGRRGRAKIARLGPDVKKLLWDYQKSLPEGTPDEEKIQLLESRYKDMRMAAEDLQRRKDYPTSESAVGTKNI